MYTIKKKIEKLKKDGYEIKDVINGSIYLLVNNKGDNCYIGFDENLQYIERVELAES